MLLTCQITICATKLVLVVCRLWLSEGMIYPLVILVQWMSFPTLLCFQHIMVCRKWLVLIECITWGMLFDASEINCFMLSVASGCISIYIFSVFLFICCLYVVSDTCKCCARHRRFNGIFTSCVVWGLQPCLVRKTNSKFIWSVVA